MRLRLRKLLFSMMLLAALPTAKLLAAEGSAEQPFRSYSTVDGLTQSDVYDIEQDRAGYLWFTTARGLNRYDGREFDHFTIANGLPTNTLTALHIAIDNTVWVGDAKGGVSMIRGAGVVHVIEPIGINSAPITDIETLGNRMLVVAEGEGILEVVPDGLDYRLEPLGGKTIGASNLAVFGAEIWVTAASGMYRLTFNPHPELQQVSDIIVQAHFAADGTLWVADLHNRIGTWQNGVFEVRAIVNSPNKLIGIASGADDTVWAATESELFSFDGSRSESVQSGAMIQKYGGIDDLSTLFVDRENILWLSSESRLVRYLGDRFRHFPLQTESESETVWSISEDARGRFWFGTQTKLLVRETDETLNVIGPHHGIPRGAVRDIVHSASGDMWVGVREHGLFVVNTDTLDGELIAGTEDLEILDVGVADDDTVWFSTYKFGVFRYLPIDGDLKRFPSPNDAAVYTFDIWTDGSVWYGADEVGVVHLIPQANGHYEQEIFEPTLGLHNAFFDHLRLTGENEFWVATEEGGLYRFRSGSFTNYGTATPLADQTVYLVEALENGTVIVGGEQGLYQFIPGFHQMAHYDHLAGFVGLETNVHATFIDSDNHLWIGTVEGATRMDISLPMPNHIKPTPQILRMETELDRIPIVDNLKIDPRQRGAHIEFAAVSLLNPKGIKYSYKLAGVDKEWGVATSDRSVNYSSMPPGSYEFMVRARYSSGNWSREHASRSFTIVPFFWQQPWFVLLLIALVIVAFRTMMIYRTRNIERVTETLRAQVADRTRSIERAKERLQLNNVKLSREIRERKRVDKARADIETRFRRAFENAPIGMGLLDDQGRLFNTNPVLRNMFWPDSGAPPQILFSETMNDSDRGRFTSLYEKLINSELQDLDEEFTCTSVRGGQIHTVVNVSVVRSETDDFLYAVLQIQDVTESRRLTDQLEYQASYDELTGLLNRRSFEMELARAWKQGTTGKQLSYLMYMDVDQFKVVNDTSGHAAGDQLLRNVSEILLDIVRANDTVCRLGGDEFGIILWNCPADVAKNLAESIRASVERSRFHWEKEIYHTTISIGGLPIDPEIGEMGEIQQLADAACYAAKEAGRNGVHMVAGEKDSARVHRGQVRWVQRLREAMDNNRFAIYGQIIKPLAEDVDEPERLEILLRLRDPESRKLIPPGAFLPAAERYGLSTELDQWVVRTLLDTVFIHQSFQAEHRSYWINLSGTSVGDQRFARFLTNAIKNSPLPPGTVNFEITETAVIRSVVEAGKLMSALHEMGCQFALDDFGSGLSSFGYLKKLPVDYLKIDGMFVRDILTNKTNRIFVKSIIDIAHALDLKTVAEFIENDEILEAVRDLGADYGQGFAINRPFELAPQFSRSSGADPAPADAQEKTG